MLEHGGSKSKLDPTLFYWCDDTSSLVGIFAAHVDDFIWSGGVQFECAVNKIRAAFKVGRENSKAFKYCGIELTSINGDIYLNQDKYTENMTPIRVDPTRAQEKSSLLTEKEKHTLRSKVGQLYGLLTKADLIYFSTLVLLPQTLENVLWRMYLMLTKSLEKQNHQK